MATYTPNYNLEKPDASDDFGDFRASYNSNMDTIDQNLGGGGGGDKHIIVDPNGTTMPTRSKLKFTGSVSVTDDSANNQTVVDITGGGGGGGELYLDNGLIGSDAGVYVTCNLDKTLENGFYLIRVFDSSNSAVGFFEMKWEGTSQVLSISSAVSQGRLEITSTTAGLTYYSGAWRNIYCDILSLGGSGGGSGDTVSWTQIQATGEKIAEITINGTTTDVLIPFEAKIIVTTTTGLTVTATKGGTTYTATETSTGVYEVTVDSKGTWTVTDGTNTATVSVTAQTTYNVAFVVIPDGSTVTPTDDIQTWLNCANIWDKSYTTLAEVLADTTTLSALISSNNAVDYLVRSTSWAVAQALVPTMTSNTTPSGVASASTERDSARAAWKAFDNDNSTAWNCNDSEAGGTSWVGYEFPNPTSLSKIYYLPGAEVNTFAVTLKGSNDNVNFDTLYTGTMVTTTATISDNTKYKYFRLYVTVGSGYRGAFNTVQLYTAAICDNSTAMTYIGLNNYCANKLLADATWRTAICNSTYFESVLNVKVPTMTSDTTPSGVCFGSTYYQAQYDYYKVFDNDNSTRWASAEGDTTGSYVGYQFTSSLRVIKVAIKTTATATGKIQGSNDGLTYNDIASINIATAETIMSFVFANSNNYSYYRFYNTTAGYVSPYTLQFYGREDV